MRTAKTIAAAAALALAGGSIAQAEVREAAPVSGENEIGGLTYGTQFLAIVAVVGVIAGIYAITDDDDDPVSA